VSSGGKFTLYAVPNGLLFLTPTQPRFSFERMIYRCLKIREFGIQSVVGDHFNSPNMEIKKIGPPPTKIHWSKGALFEVRFVQTQAEKFSVYFLLWCR
jgi:hypothetical protein